MIKNNLESTLCETLAIELKTLFMSNNVTNTQQWKHLEEICGTTELCDSV